MATRINISCLKLCLYKAPLSNATFSLLISDGSLAIFLEKFMILLSEQNNTRRHNQCCGSGMFIPDPNLYPSRIPNLGSRISDPKQKQKRGVKKTVLWNRNYLLRFRFWLLKSYGSGSGPNFWKVLVPVPVPTFYLDHKKQFFKKNFGIYF